MMNGFGAGPQATVDMASPQVRWPDLGCLVDTTDRGHANLAWGGLSKELFSRETNPLLNPGTSFAAPLLAQLGLGCGRGILWLWFLFRQLALHHGVIPFFQLPHWP